jgi:vacuolar protein-sorting-associated protein 4
VATEAYSSTFISVSSSDLVSKWQGESAKLVRSLFELAREEKRAIIFIDEVDSLCGSRSEGEADSSNVIHEILVQMDGVGHSSKDVFVLGATNVPWKLDSAIRRRFEKRVYIPLPNKEARSLMIKLNLGNDEATFSLSEQDFDRLGEITEGASGSDIKVLVKEALMQPLKTCQKAHQFMPIEKGRFLIPCEKYPNCPQCLDNDHTCRSCGAIRMQLWDMPPDKLKAPPISIKDFEKALNHSVSSVSPEELQRYEDWTRQFGQEGS